MSLKLAVGVMLIVSFPLVVSSAHGTIATTGPKARHSCLESFTLAGEDTSNLLLAMPATLQSKRKNSEESGHSRIVEILLAAGARTDVENKRRGSQTQSRSEQKSSVAPSRGGLKVADSANFLDGSSSSSSSKSETPKSKP